MSQIVCNGAGSYIESLKMCSICDVGNRVPPGNSFTDKEQCKELLLTMMNIFRMPHFQRLTRARVVSVLTVRKLLLHSPNSSNLDLRTSLLGQWCLQALRSGLRDLRIAAG